MWIWVSELLEYRESSKERARQHELDLRVCNSCETLKSELARAHSRELELLSLIKPNAQESFEPHQSKTDIPIGKKPWAVKRQELEKKYSVVVPRVTADNLDHKLEQLKGKS